MPQNFTILVDDQDSQINYLCPSLKQIVAGSYSNNTWTTIQSESCSNGWFEYTFYGTGVRINSPVAHPTQNVSVKLDNGPFNSQQGDGSYESPVLPDGKHTITYAIGDVALVPVFDYLTVTAGPSTPLNGRALIVDDTDTSIVFQGNWSTTPPNPVSLDYSTSLYQDTAHWTSTIGDTIEFQFTGTSVSVFGLVANIASKGNITATYTIDGVPKTQSIPKGTFDSVPMTQLFHTDVPAGQHTLLVNLTDIAYPRALGIDFVAYNTSVDSVTSLFGYTTSPTSNATPNGASSATSHSSQKWAIVGGVLGAVVFLALAIAAFFVWKARYRKRTAAGLESNNSSFDDIDAMKKEAKRSSRY